MKPVFFTLFFSSIVTGLSGCSAEKKFANRLRGTWEISRYDVNDTRAAARASSDLGTITFNKNHTGVVEIRNVFTDNRGNADSRSFRWSNTANSVTISGDYADLSKAWIVITNKKKFQLWKSTDGYNRIQEIELKR